MTGIAQNVLDDLTVDLGHLKRLGPSFFLGRVRCVTFLPQELGGPEEQARPHLPTQDVAPLVVEEREIPVALHPARVRVPDDCLGRGPDGERLIQLLAAAVRHDRNLGSEALDMLGFGFEQLHREEQREVDVLVAGRLEAIVELSLHPLPDRVAVRLDDHRALDEPVLGHAGLPDDLVVPGWEILALTGKLVLGQCAPSDGVCQLLTNEKQVSQGRRVPA